MLLVTFKRWPQRVPNPSSAHYYSALARLRQVGKVVRNLDLLLQRFTLWLCVPHRSRNSLLVVLTCGDTIPCHRLVTRHDTPPACRRRDWWSPSIAFHCHWSAWLWRRALDPRSRRVSKASRWQRALDPRFRSQRRRLCCWYWLGMLSSPGSPLSLCGGVVDSTGPCSTTWVHIVTLRLMILWLCNRLWNHCSDIGVCCVKVGRTPQFWFGRPCHVSHRWTCWWGDHHKVHATVIGDWAVAHQRQSSRWCHTRAWHRRGQASNLPPWSIASQESVRFWAQARLWASLDHDEGISPQVVATALSDSRSLTKVQSEPNGY